MNLLEIFAAITTLLGVFFASRGSKITWYMSFLSIASCSILFFNNQLYAQVLLQLVYLSQSVYGLFTWSKNTSEVQVVKMTNYELTKTMTWFCGLTGLIYVVFNSTNDANPLIDSFITGLSLIANYLLIKKKVENWLIWVASNLLSISLFTEQKLYIFALLYIVIGVISAISYFKWKKESEKTVFYSKHTESNFYEI